MNKLAAFLRWIEGNASALLVKGEERGFVEDRQRSHDWSSKIQGTTMKER